MKLPSYRRIYKTDYKEEFQPLVESLAVTINNAFDTIYNALNGNLTLKENIASTISEFTVTVDSSGTPVQDTQFRLSSNQKNVEGLIVINAYGTNSTNVTPYSGVFVAYTKNDEYVSINRVLGIDSGTQYTIKVLVIG
jgi:hypothetical protein